MNRGMEAMGGRVVKRYRVYERMLGDAGEPNAAAAGAEAPGAEAPGAEAGGAEAQSEGLASEAP
jgi:hypothetical protein